MYSFRQRHVEFGSKQYFVDLLLDLLTPAEISGESRGGDKVSIPKASHVFLDSIKKVWVTLKPLIGIV